MNKNMKDKSQPTIKVGLVKPKPDTDSTQNSASLLDTVVENLSESPEKPQKQDIPPQKKDISKKSELEMSPTKEKGGRKLEYSDEFKQSEPLIVDEKEGNEPVKAKVVGRKRSTLAIVVALASVGLQLGLPAFTGKPATEEFVESHVSALDSQLDGIQVELKGYTNQNVNAMKFAFEEYQSSLEEKSYVTSGEMVTKIESANDALEVRFADIEQQLTSVGESQLEKANQGEVELKNLRSEIGSVVVATSDAFSEAGRQTEKLQDDVNAALQELSRANDEIRSLQKQIVSLTKKLEHSEVERTLLAKVERRLGDLESQVFELSQSSLSLNQGELARLEESLNSILQEIELKLLNRY